MKTKLTGINAPFGGISWDTKTTNEDRLKYLFLYLESKRVLDNPMEMEIQKDCIKSVLEIKRTLVDITKDIDFKDHEIKAIRSMINACNVFLNAVQNVQFAHIIYENGEHSWDNPTFDNALKKFRKSFKDAIYSIEICSNLKFNKTIPEKW